MKYALLVFAFVSAAPVSASDQVSPGGSGFWKRIAPRNPFKYLLPHAREKETWKLRGSSAKGRFGYHADFSGSGERRLRWLVEGLKANPNTLENLSLSHCSIGSEQGALLGKFIKRNNTVKALVLNDNRIGDGIKDFASGLRDNFTLQELYLQRNNLSYGGFKRLMEDLSQHSTLKKLDLSHNPIGGESRFTWRLVRDSAYEPLGVVVSSVAKALGINTSLNTLDLEDCRLEGPDFEVLAAGLRESESLTTLDLSGNNPDTKGIRALARALESNTTLQFLKLDNCGIDDAGAEALAKALATNTALERLTLAGNRIGYRGAAKLAQALEGNEKLQVLSLDNNSIGNEGAKCLAEGLGVNRTLEFLSLQNCGVDGQGMRTLAAALEGNETLKGLLFDDNPIGSEGTEHLARALKVNRFLKALCLNNCGIDDRGAEVLVSALEKNAGLKGLELGDNLFGDEALKRLEQIAAEKQTLEVRFRTRDCGGTVQYVKHPHEVVPTADFLQASGENSKA